jgi:hypothetical protein
VLDPSRFPALARLSASGLHFLLLGALAGPGLLGTLGEADLARLRPLVALGLGMAGVILGLNLEPRLLRLLPGAVWAAALAHSGLAFLLVALPLLPALIALQQALGGTGVVGAAALLGAAACLSSGHFAVLGLRTGALGRARGLSISLLTMLDDAVGLLVLALALVLGAAEHPLEGMGLVALALLLGVLCGALLAFLAHALREAAEMAAVVLGGVALVAGAAAYLRLSALLAGVACGATLALVGGRALDQAARALGRFERPVYLVLVFLGGCQLQVTDGWAWLLLPAFVGLRFVGKVLGGGVARRLAAAVLELPERLGHALIAQGALSLCLVIDYRSLVPGPFAQRVFDVVVLAALVNEMLAARAFRSVLERSRAVAPPRAGLS